MGGVRMKQYLAILFLMLSGHGFAQSCSHEFEAKYEIQQNDTSKQLNVWRSGSTVAYQNLNARVTDYWTKSANDRLKLVRLFDSYEKGIEYEAKNYGNKISWENLFHKFAPQRLASMQLIQTQGVGCNKVEFYQQDTKGQTVEVEWLPEYQIAKRVSVQSKANSSALLLTELVTDSKIVAKQFAHWDSYYLTDYVDIGDNESDPFLSKMINMGFVQGGASGFYDSKGNQLSGHGHSH